MHYFLLKAVPKIVASMLIKLLATKTNLPCLFLTTRLVFVKTTLEFDMGAASFDYLNQTFARIANEFKNNLKCIKQIRHYRNTREREKGKMYIYVFLSPIGYLFVMVTFLLESNHNFSPFILDPEQRIFKMHVAFPP